MAAGTSPSSATSHHQPAGGKAANGLSSNGMNSTNHYSPLHSAHNLHGLATPGSSAGPGMGGVGSMDDGDNRTRNAKAQRRHREKRKAHLKALEESVQVLTAQLEDARRQLGQAAFYSQPANRPPGTPHSPQSKDISQLQAENAYLRDENADLRRQLYNYRATYGQGPPEDVKADPSGFAYPHPPGTISPRRNRSNDNPAAEGAGDGGAGGDAPGSANSSNSNSYPHMDHFTSMQGNGGPGHNRSRSRVMSSSSAPSASPYLASDPRAVDSRYSGGPSMRYEAAQSGMYGQPGSHQIPRYDVPPGGHSYAPRQDGSDSVSWPPESGPPPFSSYPMGFPHENGQGEEWRQEH